MNPMPSSWQIHPGNRRASQPVRISTSFRAAVFLCLCFACSGCALTQGVENYVTYNDNCNDFVMGWRNSVWARQAWHEQKQDFAGHQELRAFGAGFRDGYVGVASGGNGCPPPVPPRKYWSWHYQTPEGQCKVAAWFEGYSYGARAAEEHGAGDFQDIQVSYAIETQYSPEFEAGRIPISQGGMQFYYDHPEEPTPTETLPAAGSAIEAIDPQTGVGKPPFGHPYAGVLPAAFATQRDSLGASTNHVVPPEHAGPLADIPASGSRPRGTHASTYSSSQPPQPAGTVLDGNRTASEPTVSRLPPETWPSDRATPASFQFRR